MPCTVGFVNCFLRVPLVYNPCCLFSYGQGKPGWSQQNLLYKAFCHLVGMHKMKACPWEENFSLQERDARLKCRRSTKPTRSLCWRRTQSNLSNITGGSSAGYSQKALESTQLISCLTCSGMLAVSWSPSTIKRLVRNYRLFVLFRTEIWKS